MAGLNMKIEWETRLCKVDGKLGCFHTWEQFAEPIPPSAMVGGPPGGQMSRVYGIVEFRDRVRRVAPFDIKFIDDQNAILSEMSEHFENLKMKGENHEQF